MKLLRLCLLGMILLLQWAVPAPAQSVQTDPYTYRKPSAYGTGKYYMNREIAHVMGASNADWLERNNRPQEENTDIAISKLPLTPASTVADIGAGTGYYTFRIAAKVPQGKVYAVEIQDDLLRYLANRKQQLHNTNVEVVRGDTASPSLPAHSVDLVIMVDVYHELLYPKEMLGNIRQALTPHGKLLLLEYKAEDPGVAIKALHKMSIPQVNKEMAANGFTLSYKSDFLPMQHYLLYQKND